MKSDLLFLSQNISPHFFQARKAPISFHCLQDAVFVFICDGEEAFQW